MAGAHGAAGMFACPICGTKLASVGAVNQHLDDEHFGSTDYDASKKSLLGWVGSTAHSIVIAPMFERARNFAMQFRPDNAEVQMEVDKVTRAHWMADAASDRCLACERPFTIGVRRRHHCRCCGKLFCEDCCSYEMRLGVDAKHDPAGGVWCRVCFACYTSRPGYKQDELGATRSHWKAFKRIRKPVAERAQLEVSRLELRLDKLQRIYDDPTITSASKRTEREQAVIPWEEATASSRCRICRDPLPAKRAQHCRVCGHVTCAQPKCSFVVALDERPRLRALPPAGPATPSGVPTTRMCAECLGVLTLKQRREEEKTARPPILILHEGMKKIKAQVAVRLPEFQRLLNELTLQSPGKERARAFAECQQLRKGLMDLFNMYDALSKKIATIPVEEGRINEQRVHTNMMAAANYYLQISMVSLTLLPKDDAEFDKGRPAAAAPSPAVASASSPSSSSASLMAAKRRSIFGWASSFAREAPPELPPRSPAAGDENGKLWEELNAQMEVLAIQRRQVQQFIADHKRQGNREEVKTLQNSLLDIDLEMERLKTKMAEAKRA